MNIYIKFFGRASNDFVFFSEKLPAKVLAQIHSQFPPGVRLLFCHYLSGLAHGFPLRVAPAVIYLTSGLHIWFTFERFPLYLCCH